MFNNFNIDGNTIISAGTSLSKNFIIGHLSSGAYHYVLGRIIPTFTSILKPGSSTLPTWQVAANLQMGSQALLENLMREFGSDLILKSAFIGGKGLESLGQSFDIQVRGFENNMYNVSKQVKLLCGKASGLSLNYGSSSSMTINFDKFSIMNNSLTSKEPTMITKDLLSNIIETGLTSINGV